MGERVARHGPRHPDALDVATAIKAASRTPSLALSFCKRDVWAGDLELKQGRVHVGIKFGHRVAVGRELVRFEYNVGFVLFAKTFTRLVLCTGTYASKSHRIAPTVFEVELTTWSGFSLVQLTAS